MEYTEHGGGCCGISHVHGFYHGTVRSLDAIIERHDSDEDGHGQGPCRILEAVLSERQLYPAPGGQWDERRDRSVVDAGGWGNVLAARNFHLVSSFVNSNSGRRCYVFHRLPRDNMFEDCRNLPFQFRNGGVQEHRLPDDGGIARQGNAFVVGDTVRVINRDLVSFGQSGRVIAVEAHRVSVRMNIENVVRHFNSANISILYPAPVANRPAVPPVVKTFYGNVYRDGRRGALFPTLEAAREAAPRCRQQYQLQIRSDGTELETMVER